LYWSWWSAVADRRRPPEDGDAAAGVAGAEEDSRGESKMTVVVGSFVLWAGGAFFFGDS